MRPLLFTVIIIYEDLLSTFDPDTVRLVLSGIYVFCPCTLTIMTQRETGFVHEGEGRFY